MSGPNGKPFNISKRLVWRAWEQVKANKGAAGVDGVSIEEFEADLKDNLSAVTYFPRFEGVSVTEFPTLAVT